MQKAAKWNIPLAVGIGATYSLYTQLPTMHKSMFYWWVSWKQLIWKIWASIEMWEIAFEGQLGLVD